MREVKANRPKKIGVLDLFLLCIHPGFIDTMESKGITLTYVVPSYNGCMLAGREIRKGVTQNMQVCPEEVTWKDVMDFAVKSEWVSGKSSVSFAGQFKEKMRSQH